ncbi:MAG: hypothetical protein PHQ11_04045 [Paludibacter sp.]|nr:hypothetical protein [Paludibacter sp.]MDD4198290.1 hypothetical protein [Paludibacter sp.]MDD4426974.1 hypothetical protein [Paludibacter sp.]
MKTTIKTLLFAAIAVLTYFCFMSVLTPIRFEKIRAEREKNVIQTLINLRTAQIEHRDQKGYYTSSLDSLITFIKTGRKKMVLKEGVLTDAQLLAGLTEAKAAAIVRRGNKREIIENGLEGFRRDTTTVPLLQALYADDLSAEALEKIKYIPYSEQVEFEMELNNGYVSSNGISIPLCEIRAPYKTFLLDVNRQETLNLIDLQEKLEKYPGVKVGAANEPNNFAGNWE